MSTQTVNVTMSGSRKRRIKDKLASVSVTAGGILVLVALLLIFFYLLYVVKPIFDSATITRKAEITLPVQGQTALLGIDDQNQIGYRFSREGQLDFFQTAFGRQRSLGRRATEPLFSRREILTQPQPFGCHDSHLVLGVCIPRFRHGAQLFQRLQIVTVFERIET